MLASLIYSLWYSSCSSLLHMELYALKRMLEMRLGKPYKPAARGKSIRNHTPAKLLSDAYGRSMGVLVFSAHGRKNP